MNPNYYQRRSRLMTPPADETFQHTSRRRPSLLSNVAKPLEIVDIKIDKDIKNLGPSFDSADIPWIEHSYKTAKNHRYHRVRKEFSNFTRTRRKSSVICKVSEVLKLIYLTRTRAIAPIRVRLALLEMAHRRRCAGKVGTFSMIEMRRLIGTTRISDKEILDILHNPRVDITEEALNELAAITRQIRMDRPVWIPRRLLRHLAKEGSRLEIASMLVMMVRRLVSRFNRARVSGRMIAVAADAKLSHVQEALLSLQEKKLILKNRQAERWSVNRWGTLWDFPEDLSIDPTGTGKPPREVPHRARKAFSSTLYGSVFALLAATTGCQPCSLPSSPPVPKGAQLIKRDPILQLEPQLLMPQQLPLVPPNRQTEVDWYYQQVRHRRLFEIDQGAQGLTYRHTAGNVRTAAAAAEFLSLYGYQRYQELRAVYPPRIPREGFVDASKN